MKLSGIGAVVTGATKGLGRATAEELARRGAKVVLVARDERAVDAEVRRLREMGFTAFGVAADIGDKLFIHPLAGRAAALAGPIDLLIHNASTLGPTPLPLLMDTACEDLSRVLEVNLVGPFRLTKAIAGSMAVRGRGLVVHISSDAAVNAYPRWGSYGVSKAALDYLSRTFAAEFEDTGVKFWSLDPGEMDTQMHRDAIPDAEPASLQRSEDVARKLVRLIERDESLPSGVRRELSRALTEEASAQVAS